MAEIKIAADSGGGSVSWKGPSSTTSNAAVQLTLPVDDGSADQFLKTNGSGVTSWADAGGGKILQVVQTAKTDTTTMSSTTTFTDISGMSVAITPSDATSKVLVQFHVNISNLSNGAVHLRLMRGSTAIAVGDASSSRGPVTVMGAAVQHGNDMKVRSMLWLDSPNTTSATTYKLQWQGGVDPVLNRSKDDGDSLDHPRGVSTITVMEVGA